MSTLAQALTLVLDRVGLDSSESSFVNRARQYINHAQPVLHNAARWWWLDQTTTFKTTETFGISSAAGTFTAGETITGGTSASTAIVDSYDATNALLYIYTPSAVFTVGETVTGGSSSATAQFDSMTITRIYTPVSSNITSWWSFADETNQNAIEIVGPDTLDLSDLDRDETGDIRRAYVGGMDDTTGYPTIEVYPKPSATNSTIRVRYRVAATEWTNANDATSLLVLGYPQVAEQALVYWASRLYAQEKGDGDLAAQETENFNAQISVMKKQNLAMQGNRRYRSEPEDRTLVRTDGTGIVFTWSN